MNYVIEKIEDGFTLTFEGEEPQFFDDIVELEDVLVTRLKDVQLYNVPLEEYFRPSVLNWPVGESPFFSLIEKDGKFIVTLKLSGETKDFCSFEEAEQWLCDVVRAGAAGEKNG